MKTKTGNPKPMIKVASLFIILSLTAGLILTSCKKDKEEVVSYIDINTEHYTLFSSDLGYTGVGSDINIVYHQYSLYLMTSGVSIASWSGRDPVYSGDGLMAQFNLSSTDSEKPAAGEYPYNEVNADGNRLVGAGWFTITAGSRGEFNEFSTGIPEVTYDGSTMSITYNGTDEYGKTISLFFSGVPVFYDLSDDN